VSSPDYTRAPWLPDEPKQPNHSPLPPTPVEAVPVAQVNGARPPLPQAPTPTAPPGRDGREAVSVPDALADGEYQVVEDLRDRVSTRLTVEDKDYAPSARRELTKKLIRDEYDQWQLYEANRGTQPLPPEVEEKIFAAVLAELDGLGRVAPLLARDDIEDIHFEGSDPTMLRLTGGTLIPGPPIARNDEDLEQLLRAIGARSGDGQTSREFSSHSPVLNVRLKGVTDLGARLQAAMDVLPRPAGVIRIHRFSEAGLDELRDMSTNMIDTPMHAFLYYAVLAGASTLVSGNPSAGKTTLLRALLNAVPWENVVVTVEDERELGTHLPRWDARTGRMVKRHAVCRTFESRLPNAEGMGGFDMTAALHEALRTSPTWAAVGEVRGPYVTALLEAATSGISSVMCTIHARTATGVFKKVLINALKANPAPSPELVMSSLSELDLVVHVHRDQNYDRYVSGIYELGEPGDSGVPALTPIFDDPRKRNGRPVAKGAGALSEGLRERLETVGFDAERWLDPSRVAPDWRVDGRAAGWQS
jgi:pilus assembly protein CpaF